MNYLKLYNTAKADIAGKMEELRDVKSRCERAKRPPTNSEAIRGNKVLAEVDKLENDMEFYSREGRLEEPDGEPEKTQIGPYRSHVTRGYEKRDAGQDKEFASLFGNGKNNYRWNDRESTFWQALLGGRHHPELTKRAMNEGTPSDGGFLVPVEYSKNIHDVALESEIVMPRCQVQPMTSNEIKLPAMEIGDHSANLFGGFTASWKPEAGSLSEANPKTRMMTLSTNKLTGFIRASNELIHDMTGSGKLTEIAGRGLGWYRDSAVTLQSPKRVML